MGDLVTITPGLLRGWPLPRPAPSGGKDSRGAVVVAGGSRATPGAVLLAGLAALRVGAGKLSIATAASVAPALAVAVPESGVTGLVEDAEGRLGQAAADGVPDLVGAVDAVVLGPGLAGREESRAFATAVLAALPAGAGLVLDAFGLTCGVLDGPLAPGRQIVLTPNATEAGFLLDAEVADDAPQLLATRYAAVVALNGTVAAPDGRRWVSQEGDAGLGTSGSGDVLAGVIGGLLARGAPAEQAAVWGVHLHAQAGEALATRVGPLGFLARELLEELPGLLTRLSR